MKFTWNIISGLLICLLPVFTSGQNMGDDLRIWGNFQMDAQYYQPDSLIGAPEVPEKIRMNGFANLNLSYKNVTVGLRYESYQNPLLGFDSRYKGSGVPYRFATYKEENLEVTVGNFYEQYGNGLILRSYVEPNLGIDNSLDGIRLLYRPHTGITIRTLIGEQRLFFEKGPGIVRGADAELNFNEVFARFEDSPNRWSIGVSGISKYQRDQDPLFVLPENVAAFSGRINFSGKALAFNAEYAWKVNDPSAENNLIYRPGQALIVSGSYSFSGFGLLLSAKRIDNMGFRSDRNATGNDLNINYLPAMTRQHTYALTAMYPYATQPNGELGFMAETNFKIPAKSLLGGPYGTNVTINFSWANAIDKNPVNDTINVQQAGTKGYNSPFFSAGNQKYFQDMNVEISRRFSRKLKTTLIYMNQFYNQNIIEGYTTRENIKAHILAADIQYRLRARRSLRGEIQHLSTQQENGNWAMALLEYNIAPHWFFALSDQYNYGNPEKDKQQHYFSVSAGYTQKGNRFSLSYGKQRQGIICVGGVCRVVPASSGLSLSVTSTF